MTESEETRTPAEGTRPRRWKSIAERLIYLVCAVALGTGAYLVAVMTLLAMGEEGDESLADLLTIGALELLLVAGALHMLRRAATGRRPRR
jgi:hypothetical protein